MKYPVRLKHYRELAGLTEKEMVEKLKPGITLKQYRKIENGEADIRFLHLHRIIGIIRERLGNCDYWASRIFFDDVPCPYMEGGRPVC